MRFDIVLGTIAGLGMVTAGFLIPSNAMAAAAPPSKPPTCALNVNDVNFGSVDVLLGSSSDVTGTVNLNCYNLQKNRTHRFCISIGAGTYFSGNQRQLGSGSERVDYQFYQDAARTFLWGSWQTGFNVPGLLIDLTSDSVGNLVANIPLYARLFGNQPSAAPGTYNSLYPASNTGAYLTFKNNTAQPCETGNFNAQAGFAVSATVIPSCNVSATNVNFGSVAVLDEEVDALGAVGAQCSSSLPYSVSLNGGNAGASDPTQRKMSKGSEEITYGLYRDSSRLLPWGSTEGVDTVAGTGAGTIQNHTVYGRIPVQTTGSSGTYSDTIVVTVTY